MAIVWWLVFIDLSSDKGTADLLKIPQTSLIFFLNRFTHLLEILSAHPSQMAKDEGIREDHLSHWYRKRAVSSCEWLLCSAAMSRWDPTVFEISGLDMEGVYYESARWNCSAPCSVCTSWCANLSSEQPLLIYPSHSKSVGARSIVTVSPFFSKMCVAGQPSRACPLSCVWWVRGQVPGQKFIL